MKITHSSKIQSLILAAALSIGLGFVSPVSAQVRSYIVDSNGKGLTDLGTLGGDVAVASTTPGRWWDPAAGLACFYHRPQWRGHDRSRDAGWSSVRLGINDAGQVVGYCRRGPHAFITGPNGVGMTDLGTLGGDYSVAYGINDAGQVVGYSSTAAGAHHAFITGPNGVGMTDLGTLGGRLQCRLWHQRRRAGGGVVRHGRRCYRTLLSPAPMAWA